MTWLCAKSRSRKHGEQLSVNQGIKECCCQVKEISFCCGRERAAEDLRFPESW
jgi:hypothetical protein